MHRIRVSNLLLGLCLLVFADSCGLITSKKDSSPQYFVPARYGIMGTLIGPDIIMDTTITKKLLADPQHKPIYVDDNHDGNIDEKYFIDNNPLNSKKYKPILVKIIDQGDDLYKDSTGDKINDLYVVDYNGDGNIDRAIDYVDTNHDGFIDEQYFYGCYGDPSKVLWAKNFNNDDNRLFTALNYEYNQQDSQWLSDFNGDEQFSAFLKYDPNSNKLIPNQEISFTFYDPDGDSYSEEALRLTGTGTHVNSMRFSMDIDNDNQDNPPRYHDYDFSITGIGSFDLPSSVTSVHKVRNIETTPIADWAKIRSFVKQATWNKKLLSWVENDANVAWGGPLYERWEGVINHANKYFPEVGGPSIGEYNVRNEVVLNPSSTLKMYWSNYDHKLHLYGAKYGWIKVDYNFDNSPDMIIGMKDTNNDGFFDEWYYDMNGDSTFEDSVHVPSSSMTLYNFDFNTLSPLYLSSIKQIISDDKTLVADFKKLLQTYESNFTEDPIEVYYQNDLQNFRTDYGLGKRIKNSTMGTRYYYDLIRERYWQRLQKTAFINRSDYASIKSAYDQGNYSQTISLLANVQ